MTDPLRVNHVNELRVSVTFTTGRTVSLRDLERFCEALRSARAGGTLPIAASHVAGEITVSAVATPEWADTDD